MELDVAIEAARRGEWATCLSTLLAAWRRAKQPELGALIERVSPHAGGAAMSAGASLAKTIAKRMARAGDVDVGPILEAAIVQVRTYPRAYEYIVQLAGAVPEDPRIATALMSLIEQSPWAGVPGGLQGDVIGALYTIDDPRYRARIIEVWNELEPQRARIRKYRADLDLLGEAARALALRSPPADISGLAGAITAIDAALGAEPVATSLAGVPVAGRAQDAGELLAAIYADPDDVSLRMIYADVLQDRGDPRGELIALQCARADDDEPSRRERQLLKQHAREWLGELEPAILKEGLVYRRGFLACARLGWKTTTAEHLASPMWSTIEEVECAERGEHAAFLLDPRWKRLRRVFGLYAGTGTEEIPALVGHTLPWTTLGLRYPTSETWAVIADVVPALVELDLAADVARTEQEIAGLGAFRARLRRVRAATAYADAGAILAAIRAAKIPELELVPKYFFPAEPAMSLLIIGDQMTILGSPKLPYLAKVLGSLARYQPTSAVATLTAARPLDDATWNGLKDLARPFKLEVVRNT